MIPVKVGREYHHWAAVAVVAIGSNAILVLGGCTGGEDVAEAKALSITTVEKGRAALTLTAASIPTELNACIVVSSN